MEFNLNEEAMKKFEKCKEKLISLRRKVAQEKDIFEASPSYELKRAINGLPYHLKEVEEMESNLEEQIKKLKAKVQAAKDRLEAAKERIEAEKSRKPKSLCRAESELHAHIELMNRSFTLPKTLFPEIEGVVGKPEAVPIPVELPKNPRVEEYTKERGSPPDTPEELELFFERKEILKEEENKEPEPKKLGLSKQFVTMPQTVEPPQQQNHYPILSNTKLKKLPKQVGR